MWLSLVPPGALSSSCPKRLSTWSFRLTMPRETRSYLYVKLRFLQSSVPPSVTSALVVRVQSISQLSLRDFLSDAFQCLRPNLSPRIWSLHAGIYPRFSLHWVYSRSPCCRRKYALSVGPSVLHSHSLRYEQTKSCPTALETKRGSSYFHLISSSRCSRPVHRTIL